VGRLTHLSTERFRGANSEDRWHFPQDFWTTIKKGINHYTEQPHKRTTQSKENEPQKLFRATFNTPRNLLQQAFRTQSHIDWDNFLKGRISRDWITYGRHNEENSNGHGKSHDWSAKLIRGLWEHLKRLWQLRKVIYHQENEGAIARYKLKALERDMEKLWVRHIELLPRLWDFQKQHFDRRQRIVILRYEIKKYWATLAQLYIDDAETTDTAVTVKSIRPKNGEQEWDNQAPNQLSRAGIVANVLLPSFEKISLVKAQLK
jgi:hypothetical protein